MQIEIAKMLVARNDPLIWNTKPDTNTMAQHAVALGLVVDYVERENQRPLLTIAGYGWTTIRDIGAIIRRGYKVDEFLRSIAEGEAPRSACNRQKAEMRDASSDEQPDAVELDEQSTDVEPLVTPSWLLTENTIRRSFAWDGEQSVYIYRYAAMPNRVKIGSATGDPIARIRDQFRCITGLPCAIELVAVIRCEDAVTVEKIAHRVLKKAGKHVTDAPGTEWFDESPENVLRFIDKLGDAVNSINL